MATAEQVFVYDFGSSRARYSNFISIPPEIDIPDKPDITNLLPYIDLTWLRHFTRCYVLGCAQVARQN